VVDLRRPDDPREDDSGRATRPRRVLSASAYFDRIWNAAGEGPPENFVLRRTFLLAERKVGERVLDLGCGLGEFTAALAEHGVEVVGCDVSQEALRLARERFPTLEFVLSGDELPFGDATFDVVWAGEVLEHVQDGLGLLAEVRRVLVPGGRLLVSTPDHGPIRRLWLGLSRAAFERNFDPRSDHVRFFTARTLRATLEAADLGQPQITRRARTLLAIAPRS
jgi:SAM-dependent methyltransferase